jgi:hypothetical protein
MTSLPIAPTSSPDYQSTITEITVHDASRNVLTDWEATVVKLADEGGGAYVTIIQGENEIRLDYNELPLVNEAIDRLMMQYKTEESPKQEQSDDKHVLAVGQRWRRADGEEVIVCRVSDEHRRGAREPIGSFYASPNGLYEYGDGWWYEDDGTVSLGIADIHPELNLVELLQP